MVLHQAKRMNMHEQFSRMFNVPVRKNIVRRRVLVIKNKKVVKKSNPVFLIEDNISFIYSAIENMIQFCFHIPILSKLGHPMS